MAKKKSINIGSLTADAQAVILKQAKDAAIAQEEADANDSIEEVEFYYDLKAELEKRLSGLLKEIGSKLTDKDFSIAKKLKIIANLPPKKTTTPKGFIKAHKAIVTGKVGGRKRAQKAEDGAIIVETTKGEVKARKLAPRKKKAAPKKSAPRQKAKAKKA